MAKYVIEEKTLQSLADALRSVTGETRSYTPTEMIEAVATIMETGTYILVDEDGNEVPAVFVENETRFTATANDIRIGTTAVTDSGVTEGTKEIPSYQTTEGFIMIMPGKEFAITNFKRFEFTKLQAIICAFSSNIDGSVAAEKVSINGKVYSTNSTSELSAVSTNSSDRSIRFGVINSSDKPYILRYFTYKEEY